MPTQRTQYPRPINKQDSSAKFPNRLTYPNGTYASTGSIGGTGSFGANLPVNTRFPDRRYQQSQYSEPIGPVQPQVLVGGQWQTFNRQYQQPIGPNQPQYGPYNQKQGFYLYKSGEGNAQGSFVSGNGQVNLQGVTTGGRGNMNPTTTDRINAYAQQAVQPASLQPAPRPTDGQYIPGVNDDAWISYWNKVPLGTPRPNIMSRDQIWNMKAQQRRRRQEEAQYDEQVRQYEQQGQARPSKPEPAYQPFFTKTVGFRTGTG